MTTNYVNISVSKNFLVGTNFELRTDGLYSDTTITCLSGDSLFSSQVSIGDVLRFYNSETNYLDVVVKSVSSNTVLIIETDAYEDNDGKTYQRYCNTGLSNGGDIDRNIFIRQELISFFEEDRDGKYLLSFMSGGRNRSSAKAMRLTNSPVSKLPHVVYTSASSLGLNDLTIPYNPRFIDNDFNIRVQIDTVAVAQVTTVATGADSSGSLHNTYFVLGEVDNINYSVVLNVKELENEYISIDSNALNLKNSQVVRVDINQGDTANTIASLIKTELDALDSFSASVSTNTVTITNATKGKVGSIFDPIADKTATTISARTLNYNYGALFDSASGFGSYNKNQKVKITTEGGIIDGVYTVQSNTSSQIIFKEPFPENEDSLKEKGDFSVDDLGSTSIIGGRTGFTITSNGSGSSVVGANDKFKVSYDRGATFPVTTVEILGDHVLGGSGNKTRGTNSGLGVINFKNVRNHTINDYWDFRIGPSFYIKVDNTANELLGKEEAVEKEKPIAKPGLLYNR
jgi:hypothetical protein